MKVKVNEAVGPVLNWMVAECEEHLWTKYNYAVYNDFPRPRRPSEYLQDHHFGPEFAPSTDWSQGGPIIERELIALSPYLYTDDAWQATRATPDKHYCAYGPTPLVAAMRCYVASKLGDEVEVPDELI